MESIGAQSILKLGIVKGSRSHVGAMRLNNPIGLGFSGCSITLLPVQANRPAHRAIRSMDSPPSRIAIPKHNLDASPTMTAARISSVLDIHLTTIAIIIRVDVRPDIVVELTSRESLMRACANP